MLSLSRRSRGLRHVGVAPAFSLLPMAAAAEDNSIRIAFRSGMNGQIVVTMDIPGRSRSTDAGHFRNLTARQTSPLRFAAMGIATR